MCVNAIIGLPKRAGIVSCISQSGKLFRCYMRFFSPVETVLQHACERRAGQLQWLPKINKEGQRELRSLFS